ncbi:MAG TPA: hypothetical protein GXX29_14615 [Firmicutes bacterium]|nr:hypothetical protein [Bacillota bacterium]
MLDSLQRALEPGNVVRTTWPEQLDKHVNLYLGNGRCGACFDVWGLMHNGLNGANLTSISRTTLMHADHWHRGAYGLDYWLPVARLVWAGEPPGPPQKYEQRLTLYDAVLTTSMSWPALQLKFRTWFHPTQRDLWAVDVQYQASDEQTMPDLMVIPETSLRVHYKQRLSGTAATLEHHHHWWLCQIKIGTASSLIGVKVLSAVGECRLNPSDNGKGMSISFSGKDGRHMLLFGVAGCNRKEELCRTMAAVMDSTGIAAQAREEWHKRWGSSFINISEPRFQALWARSVFYTLASHAPDLRSPAPPTGWSGNGWPFHFPQDLSFIHPALLRLGHLDIARSWVEFYYNYIDDMRAFTRSVFDKPGIMWAWVFPIGPETKALAHGSPNWYHYEIHNVAYPARMAYEAAKYLGDTAWAQEVAWPVVRESARFSHAILLQEEDGTLGIHVTPSMGQDELGGQNAANYLCALFSARYALRVGCAMAKEYNIPCPEVDRWRAALQQGLAFPRLYDTTKGYYMTAEGLGIKDQVGKQKHPIQLNPIIFLPMQEPPDQPTLEAYRRRYELCVGVSDLNFAGWTLAAYWLAASHMRDASALVDDLDKSLAADYVDADWIQIYESSHSHHLPYYVTSHGLYLQALQDALLSDYWGTVEIGAACPDAWQGTIFVNLHSADGRIFSGFKAGDGRDSWQVREDKRITSE